MAVPIPWPSMTSNHKYNKNLTPRLAFMNNEYTNMLRDCVRHSDPVLGQKMLIENTKGL